MAMGAPHGIDHGKAVHPFRVVEFVRDLHEHHGLGPKQIAELLPCLRYWVICDWIYYRTRTRA